ncbi:MAG: hypothetical protein VB062_05600 [Christensenella sp.]|nr:hypothetical protein [Christensenella sp.]
MDLSNERLKKLGKKAAAAAIGFFAAAAIALGALADSPDELFCDTPQAAQAVIAATEEDERIQARSALTQPAKKEGQRARLRRLFLGQPSVVRGAVLLPVWVVGKALLSVLSLVFTALGPILQLILQILLHALLLLGLFALLLKLLFPNLRLRDLLTGRIILLLFAASILFSVTDAVLRRFWVDYRPVSIAVKLAVALLVLTLLCWRIFGKRRKQAEHPAQSTAFR